MDKATENDKEEIGKLTNWLDNRVNGTTGNWTRATQGGADITATSLNHNDIIFALPKNNQ